MKDVQRLMVLFSTATLSGSLLAAIPDKYQTIVDRNGFGLLPPPPPPSETTVAPPPADLKITGFATIGGEKYVYVAIPPKDQKAHFQYLALKQGQQDAGIEILEITDQAEVRIKNAGTPMLLSLLKNGFQGSGASAAPSPIPLPGGGMPAAQPQTMSAIYNPGGAPEPVMQFAGGGVAMPQARSTGTYAAAQKMAAAASHVIHSGNSGAGVVFNAHPQPPPISVDQPDRGTPTFAHFPDTIEVKVPDPTASPVVARDPWIRKQIPMPPLPGRAN